jgi:hypothetical protein
MKRFATILAAGVVLLSATSAMADTCFVEEMSPDLKTFGFDRPDKNIREVVRNRLIVLAGAKNANPAWPRALPTATIMCFSGVDAVPSLMQKLEVYRESGSNEFKVRESGL